MSSKTVKAGKVREGDFIPGLDNGYVFETDDAPDMRGDYNVNLAADCVAIWFHTADGNEAFLVCPDDMPITIERPTS